MKFALDWQPVTGCRTIWPVLILLLCIPVGIAHGAMLIKDYVVRYDRGWDILCDPYQVQKGDWVLKIFRQKGEIAHEDFRDFLGIFTRLNPHVKDIDRIRPGQVVDIPIKKLSQGNFPGQSSGVVTIPFVMISNPKEWLEKHTRTYTIKQGDTVSQLIAKRYGGRYGNLTYQQGVKLFQAMNPQIKNMNRIYAGQKIYMPDPSIREQAWHADMFDTQGNLVDVQEPPPPAVTATSPPPDIAPIPEKAPPPPPAKSNAPVADAASTMGGRLLDKGTYYLPMKKGGEFELDLSRHPLIDLQNGIKVILSKKDQVMNVALPLVQEYWDDVKVVDVPEDASVEEILEAVLGAVSNGNHTNRLAYDDGAASVSVTAKWIKSGPSADGSVPQHICITPVPSATQRTHWAIVRYLDQNDIIIRDVLTGTSEMAPTDIPMDAPPPVGQIDGGDQRALVKSFAQSLAFHYSPNTSISFPYAGIQVKALSNLLSFGKGREVLIDFGDLYGDAVKAIKQTGLNIIQVKAEDTSLDILQRLMEAAGLSHTRAPVFYGADRSAEFNTAITIEGLLIPTPSGQNRLFFSMPIPELIERFISAQGIELVRIDDRST